MVYSPSRVPVLPTQAASIANIKQHPLYAYFERSFCTRACSRRCPLILLCRAHVGNLATSGWQCGQVHCSRPMMLPSRSARAVRHRKGSMLSRHAQSGESRLQASCFAGPHRCRPPREKRIRVNSSPQLDSDTARAESTDGGGGDTARLFSSLDYSAEEAKLKHTPGSVFGASALVAGTTVGAGILAVPFVTEESGFLAASGAMTGMWAYSVLCGLLLAEVNLNTLCQLGKDGATITVMAERTLGPGGSRAVGVSYLFLHCAMLVAYIARAGEIISEAAPVSSQAASIGFAAGLGALCYGLKPSIMDTVNSALVGGVVLTFLGLLGTAVPGVDPQALAKADFGAVPKTLPVLSLAFVFHNIIPVIATSLEGDVRKIRTAILAGTGVPLLMFLAWDAAILGSLGEAQGTGADPLKTLIDSAPIVGPLVQLFSFLAVTTSFIGFLFGLVDFVGTLLDEPPGQKSAVSFAACILPPTLLALSYPDIFFKALDYAGTYGVLLLFGLIPAAMAWSERYNNVIFSEVNVVGGGKPVLVGLGGVAAVIIGNSAYGSLSGLLHH